MVWTRPLYLAALLLAGCSSLPKAPPSDTSPLAPQAQWQFSGKLGLWGEGIQESAQLTWRQCSPSFRIRLSGPLGSSAAILSGDEDQVTLERSGENPITADSAEELAQRLGWPLPVSALRYWVLGRPIPLEPFQGRQDASGQLTDMRQLGWMLQYSHYQKVGGHYLPGQLQLNNSQWRLKLILRDWQLQPETCAAL